MLAPDAVFLGNNAVPTTTPVPTISGPPTPSKRSIMSWTEVHGKACTFQRMIALVCTYVGVFVIPADARPEDETCVHCDVDMTLHCANLPNTKTILNLLMIL